MKAFLSHSSKDKATVEAVAKALGRQFCLFDKFVFETGEEFTDAIRRCLDQSAVFVLFASEASMQSIWVKLEIEEAWQRKLRETIKRSLVYIIDEKVAIDGLPEWLQRALVRREFSPQSIARDIRSHLDRLLRERSQPYFFGRGTDMSRLEELLSPTDGTSSPRAFVIWGLPGIGRRTLIRHGALNQLGLRKSVEIRLGEGDSINDICAKVADLSEPYSSQAEFKAIFADIQSLPQNDALARTLANLRALLASGELPIFFDEGGFLDNEGYVRPPAVALLQSANTDDDIYLAFVSFRKPQERPDVSVPLLKLNPLAKADTQRLLRRLATDIDLVISNEDVADISEYVAGYPPSAYFAAQQAKDYGVQLVVTHKRRLVEFRTGVFLRHIDALALKTNEGNILQLLAAFSPLPLPAIAEASTVDLETVVDVLTRLIDLSLVLPDDDGLYRIADPIAEAASATYGFPPVTQAQAVAKSLDRYLDHSDLHHRYLDLSRVLFRAARLSGESGIETRTVRLSGDLIRLTEEYYHSRQYDRAIECGRLAISERPDSVSARSYLIRALIQQEHWDEAQRQLEELGHHAPARDTHFLRGFLERRRGNFRAAIAEFEESLRRGRRGAAVSREVSQCYFFLGDLEAAHSHLQTALHSHGDNRYVVDLWAQLSTEMGQEDDARRALDRLEVIDRPIHYLFRKSRIEWRFGSPSDALDAALKALEIEERPPFYVVAQAALCCIADDKTDDAASFLRRLDKDYGDIRKDVRTGLHCKLETTLGNFDEALRISGRFINRDSRYYKTIRLETLQNVLSSSRLDAKTRDALGRERDALMSQIQGSIRFDIPEIDSV